MICPVSFWACIFELSTFFWLLDHQFSFGIKIHSCHKLESHSHGCKVQLILRQMMELSSVEFSSVWSCGCWCSATRVLKMEKQLNRPFLMHTHTFAKFLCVDHDPLKIQHKPSNSWTELWQTCKRQNTLVAAAWKVGIFIHLFNWNTAPMSKDQHLISNLKKKHILTWVSDQQQLRGENGHDIS